MIHLTPGQLRVLRFVYAWMSEHGYAPTTREIAKGLGLASTNGISEHLVRLGDLGLLTKEPRRSRTLKLTRAGETAAHR